MVYKKIAVIYTVPTVLDAKWTRYKKAKFVFYLKENLLSLSFLLPILNMIIWNMRQKQSDFFVLRICGYWCCWYVTGYRWHGTCDNGHVTGDTFSSFFFPFLPFFWIYFVSGLLSAHVNQLIVSHVQDFSSSLNKHTIIAWTCKIFNTLCLCVFHT